jgi:hypothetical protein
MPIETVYYILFMLNKQNNAVDVIILLGLCIGLDRILRLNIILVISSRPEN